MLARALAFVTRNWPIKLAALLLALLLYVGVAGQQPVTQSFRVPLRVVLPPGRTLVSAPAAVQVTVVGRGTEMLKLRNLGGALTLTVPDTLSTERWDVTLDASDVALPKGADVTIADIRPKSVTVQLDPVLGVTVPVAPRFAVTPDSGYALAGGISFAPTVVRVVGPAAAVAHLDSVHTVPTQITGLHGAFQRAVPIDTAPLGLARVEPKEIVVSGDVAAVAQRVFGAVPVESGAGGLAGFTAEPPRVSVQVNGAESRLAALTRDSIRVIAHAAGASDGAWVHLAVVAPPGLAARAVPDSVRLHRARRHG